jgi:hypothetical protein
MAKKRDSKWVQHGRGSSVDYDEKVDERSAAGAMGKSFANDRGTTNASEGDLEEWEDQQTAPDILADASAEGRMHASGGHTHQRDEEQGERDRPGNPKR